MSNDFWDYVNVYNEEKRKIETKKCLYSFISSNYFPEFLINNFNNKDISHNFKAKSPGFGSLGYLLYFCICYNEFNGPKNDFYVAYLFNKNLTKVYLTLELGSENSSDKLEYFDFKDSLENTKSSLKEKIDGYKDELKEDFGIDLDEFSENINLDRFVKGEIKKYNETNKKAEMYENGSIFAKGYNISNLPSEEELMEDFNKFINLYVFVLDEICDINLKEDSENNSKTDDESINKCDDNDIPEDCSRNRIIFGAPGTGKSYKLNKDKQKLLGENKENYERVTFHPDYSYAHFVGTYKPVSKEDEETGDDIISYEYVPGPFMRLLSKAMNPENSDKPFLLVIEEINRSNVAAVFGDVFQLLDRDDNNVSEYPIQTSTDMRDYLVDELGGSPDDYKTIQIPSNMFIWATMNSADQGVFVLDSAFKRRWDFTYIDINNSENKIKDKTVYLSNDKTPTNWNALRKAINKEILSYGINEDKLLGPFFIPFKYLKKETKENPVINNIFKNKILMYLFEDVAKAGKRETLFSNVKSSNDYLLYSEIYKQFDEKGIEIFCDRIINYYKEFGGKI